MCVGAIVMCVGARVHAQAAAPAPAPASDSFSPYFRLAFQTEAAFGVGGPFYNHLAGARIDRCFSPIVCAGAYLGYVNLKGKDARAHEVLPYALLEARPPLGRSLSLPLRFGAGYLPKNGPFMRVSTGLGVRVGDTDLTLEVAPAFWVTRDLPVVSIDVAIEVAFRL